MSEAQEIEKTSQASVDKGETYRSVWRYMMTVPFKQDYVEAAGIRTRYIQAGNPDAPAVILLHGTGGHWEAFSANIGPLSEHFNVYAMDFLGCGFSDKPDRPYEIGGYVDQVIAFMDAMGIKTASLIGVSLGSWVSVRAALAHPDRIDRLIQVSPSGLLPMQQSVVKLLDERRASVNDPSWEKISKILEHLYYDPETLIDDLVAVRQQVYSVPGIEKIMPRMLTLMDPEIRNRNNLSEEEWRSIKQPTLIISHVDVQDVYLEGARTIAGYLPNSEIVDMKKVAHWAQFEDPETFNPLAIEFLSRGRS